MIDIKNDNLIIKLNIDKLHIINYNHIQSIDFTFYTNNKVNAISKSLVDVDKYNYITLNWDELKLLEEGILNYEYVITLIDGAVFSDNVSTEYYICSNITNAEEYNRIFTSNYYTKDEVIDLIYNIDFSKVNIDLSNYYTKAQVDNKIPKNFITSIPSEYVTDSELNKSLSGYSKTNHTHNQYLTQHQSLNNYYQKTEIDNKLKGYSTSSHTHNNYSTTGHTHSQYLTEHQSLAEYAKLTDIPTDYIKSIPSEYVTETELNNVIGDIASVIDLINGEVI